MAGESFMPKKTIQKTAPGQDTISLSGYVIFCRIMLGREKMVKSLPPNVQ
jgi:hypothetical protein